VILVDPRIKGAGGNGLWFAMTYTRASKAYYLLKPPQRHPLIQLFNWASIIVTIIAISALIGDMVGVPLQSMLAGDVAGLITLCLVTGGSILLWLQDRRRRLPAAIDGFADTAKQHLAVPVDSMAFMALDEEMQNRSRETLAELDKLYAALIVGIMHPYLKLCEGATAKLGDPNAGVREQARLQIRGHAELAGEAIEAALKLYDRVVMQQEEEGE
jgi:hypothetical protein